MNIFMTGDEELDRKFSRFPAKVRRQLLRIALAKAAKLVLDDAVEGAPRRSGLLGRSLVVGAGRQRKFTVTRGVQTRAGLFRGTTFYGGFQEFGTVNMEANPFLAPALKKNERGVVSVFREELGVLVAEFKND